MPEPIAYLNGRYVPQSQCVLPIYDAGIVVGAAVTDLVRTFGGQPFALDEHVTRFDRSARYAYLELPLSRSELRGVVEHLVAHNMSLWPGRELAVVLYATAGEFSVYAGSAATPSSAPTVAVHSFPLPFHLWQAFMIQGVHVVTPAQRHIPANTLSSKIKHRNRLHMWIGDKQAKLVDPHAVGLYLDVDGNITETGGANFLVLHGTTILSPLRTNILWGVTLDEIARLAPQLKLDFVERDLQIHDVVSADEAWLATTPYFLAPAVKINGIPINDGKPGPIWRALMEAFSERVGVDVLGQIMASPV